MARRVLVTPEQDMHHPEDPRRLARESMTQENYEEAQIWALLAAAEGIHRLAKAVARVGVVELPDENGASE